MNILPDPAKVQALADFPAPHDVTSLRSFIGLATQLSTWTPDYAHSRFHLNKLLRKDTAWVWTERHQQEFLQIKNILANPAALVPFTHGLQTDLYVDASRKGFGYVLAQTQTSGNKSIIACGSCAISPAQSRYSATELEMAGTRWAVTKLQYYLLGHPGFSLHSDHQALVGLFAKPITEIDNPRIMTASTPR